jgi:molybdate transport system ATP-binding protein
MKADRAAIEAEFNGRLGTFAVDVSFKAPGHGVTALFGPSGCGKTTVLRCMAGLTRLGGRLRIDGEVWQDDASGMFLKTSQRRIGYVFQEASLFPHLSVRDNLLYGARRTTDGEGALSISVEDTVQMLGIGHLMERAPATLSGGERQRVAIGRALLSRPRVLLMDEPLAALDRLTKEEILPYLEALRENVSIPIFYVSHDLGEVERLADTLVLMDKGRVRAIGPLSELEADPSLPLLRAPEAAVTLDARILDIDEQYGLTTLSITGGTLIVPGRRGEKGKRCRVRISASDVAFVRGAVAETSVLNQLPVRIVMIAPSDADDAQINLVAEIGGEGRGARIVGRITRKSKDVLRLETGDVVMAQIKSVALLT